MQFMDTHKHWLLIFAAFLIGCQQKPTIESNRTAVKGTVTFDGRPLTGGGITLVSAKDPMYRVSAMIRPDGSFRVDDAPEGQVNVIVETESTRMGNAAAYIAIPAKYGDAKTSGLSATIAKGGNSALQFELKSK
jgi:hypothetical protein